MPLDLSVRLPLELLVSTMFLLLVHFYPSRGDEGIDHCLRQVDQDTGHTGYADSFRSEVCGELCQSGNRNGHGLLTAHQNDGSPQGHDCRT